MSSNLEIIAKFSPDARQFAFQANVSQKNVIDIYPLDAANDYGVNSSLVSHIDYEGNDLQASEIFFAGWCSGLKDGNKHRVKRKNDDDTGLEVDDKLENFFISVQAPGKIVVFTSSGKNIVNIIQSKSEILQVSLEDSFIWTLDNENTVKKHQYNQTKQLKSFHLVDGKDEEIVYFEVLKSQGTLYLIYATKDILYILDPSKRRPITVAKLSISGCKSCGLMDDNKVAIAAADRVVVFNYKTETVEQEWEMEVKSLKTFKDIILCQGAGGENVALKIGTPSPVCQVRVVDAEVLDFARVENGFMIAWLNVNEPNFKSLTLGDLIGNDEIVITGQSDGGSTQTEPLVDGKPDDDSMNIEVEKEDSVPIKKITKAAQIELSKSLISALDSEDKDQILDILLLEAWNEDKIKSFFAIQSIKDDSLCVLFELATSELHKHSWDNNKILSLWTKWLLTLKSASFFGSGQSKHAKKQTKRLRSSLKTSAETLPILLAIQGRLEMLRRQAQLREDLAQFNITGSDDDGEAETVVNGEEKEPLQAVGDPDESIAYANGESDTFVDASEFTDVGK